MTEQYYSILTNLGLAKEAAANNPGGSPVSLTHIAIGDGDGSVYNPVSTQTELVNEVYRTTLTHVAIDGANPNQLIIEGVINEEIGSFYIREVGIFDSDGDLFAIGKYPETFKPTLASGSGKRLYIRMIIGFTNSPQVELILSEDLNNDPNFNTNVIGSLASINNDITDISDDLNSLNSDIININSALTEKLAKAENLADLEDTAEARVNLGLEIGADIQAFAINLAAIAALSSAVNKVPYFTNALGAMSLLTIGAAIGNIPLVGGCAINAGSRTNLTIVSGVVTVNSVTSTYIIDTEGSAATDDLDTINGMIDEQIIILRIADSARKVVLKHNTGNIYNHLGTDIQLYHQTEIVVLKYDASQSRWIAQCSNKAQTVDYTAPTILTYNTVYQADRSGFLVIKLAGSYMNGVQLEVGSSNPPTTILGQWGDDINSNTKQVSACFPISKGTFYKLSPLGANGWETISFTFYPIKLN